MTQILEHKPIIKNDLNRLIVVTDLDLSITSRDNFRALSSSRLKV